MRLPDWETHLIGALTNPASHEDARGIAIYRNARRAILRTALAGAYPVCRALVGEDCFDALVRDTLAVQASTSPNLHRYGNALPDVIAQSPLAHSVPYLADVARLEWCVHWAHYAPDAHVEAANATLLAQPADTIRAGLVERAQWVVSPWPTVSIWRAHQPGATIALNEIDLGVGEAAVIAVHGHRVAVLDLDAPTATFLAACDATPSLQAALETTLAERPDFDLTACLSGLYRSGLLALTACPTTPLTGGTP
ncbi:DNA-binding domain-containing protein [Ralstonia mojiangensis]|uniref:DNA-binding domain-containing protein n=1 Tax=Ralstonia mojiangensis TaxID=2953895 RepID=A0ABT2LCQ5_9RALS|nr:DNA-binding domain-containing protein [Ralstonia mojiangensis]MCO5415185.1 DNA-binding domain-containing protein [Ralstonia mojiangensis]MCT7298340.1 DNA-binding domain-containing protein [Ralstonia mojiangensis]MCT7312677.1 DNA-binding domain-containing protein [Ralstonia mojiangensis]